MEKHLVRRITEPEAELWARLSHPEYLAAKAERLKPGSRRLLEVLASRCALKELIGEERPVVYDEYGAPALADHSQHISISHTQDYVAVIASADAPVGIDIERRGKRVERVVSHFLTDDERDLLCLLSPDEETYQLLLHLAWSAKEAAFKVLGHDYFDLRQLTSVIAVDRVRHTLLLHVERRPEPLLLHFDYTVDYVLVWL